ncbi:MAG: hypothetical protein JSW14_05220 [Candidatus Bathyarchaeum sp.]|nr:MAG: hypothetical protein JSW14_05220 [Candidatus Bathyarchaeum sp.]
MSSAKLHSSKYPMILSWLAGELKREIPEVDLYGQERSLLDFAYRDLEIFLKLKWRDLNSDELEEALKAEECQEEMKAFVKVWTAQWLEKWRERVTLSKKMPQFSLAHLKAKRKAKSIFKRMEKGQELKKMVEQKLINQGEVCMAELIAENLIIEEIAYRLKMNRGKTSSEKIALEPWNILQKVLPRVKRLTERKMPIIHLKLMIDV